MQHGIDLSVTAMPQLIVAHWPEVYATVEQLDCAAVHMRPADSRVRRDSARLEVDGGLALWVADIEGRPFGLTWEWGRISGGAVAMTDPMTVLTNLVLTDADGRMLDDAAAILKLNSVIHTLRWHETVVASQQRPH